MIAAASLATPRVVCFQLKGLDAEVLDLSRLLAVRTLQLEMEHIYRSLEDEALDMTGYESGVGDDGECSPQLLRSLKSYNAAKQTLGLQLCIFSELFLNYAAVQADREGYTSELDLLVADFVMLEEELTALDQALRDEGGSDKAVSDSRSSPASATAAGVGGDGALALGLLGEDVLEKLAVEIPDMRIRVGVM